MPGGTERSGVPSNSASPLVGCASPARVRSSVVLPAPLGPTTQANSPRTTSNVMSCRATFAPAALGYTFRTSRSDTTGVPAARPVVPGVISGVFPAVTGTSLPWHGRRNAVQDAVLGGDEQD